MSDQEIGHEECMRESSMTGLGILFLESRELKIFAKKHGIVKYGQNTSYFYKMMAERFV